MSNIEILYISDAEVYDDTKAITIITKRDINEIKNKKISFYLNSEFIICKIKFIVQSKNNTNNTIIYVSKKDIVIERNKANIRNIKLNNILQENE